MRGDEVIFPAEEDASSLEHGAPHFGESPNLSWIALHILPPPSITLRGWALCPRPSQPVILLLQGPHEEKKKRKKRKADHDHTTHVWGFWGGRLID